MESQKFGAWLSMLFQCCTRFGSPRVRNLPDGIPSPRFRLFQQVVVRCQVEGFATADRGEIIGVMWAPPGYARAWWYQVRYLNGVTGAACLGTSYVDEVAEYELYLAKTQL
ncbi:MAG: hypothetical protein F6K19_38340 [Cyanothece sp. SIO1E1]|nr:hypothetical protein [Cyanothece sp. SIO1E1]